MTLTNDAQLGDAGDFADRVASDTFVGSVVLGKHSGDRQTVVAGRAVGAQLEVLGRFDDLIVVEPLHDRVRHGDDAALQLHGLALAYLAVLHRLHQPRRRVARRRRRRLSRHWLTCGDQFLPGTTMFHYTVIKLVCMYVCINESD